MSKRYSDEAMAKVRVSNRLRFVQNSIKKFGKRFSFPYLEKEYDTQKTSKVIIGCPDHPKTKMTPDKHLHSKTGCPDCGIEIRARKRLEKGRITFLKKFENKFSDSLKIISEYDGSKSSINLECKKEGHIFPMYVGNIDLAYENGCPKCNPPSTRLMDPEEFKRIMAERFPELDFSKTEYKGMVKYVYFKCEIHNRQKKRAGDLFYKTPFGCPKCATAQIGYAGYRIRKLQSGDKHVKTRPTIIALMKMNIWGIETYKIGVTNQKSLQHRYRENLVKIYYEARLDELDALLLENLLKVKYEKDLDERIKKKGMRDGARWPGDTELFFKRAVKPMFSELKSLVQELSDNDPNYWTRFKGLELPSEDPREVVFRSGVYNLPRKVICLDDKTIYNSATEVAQVIKTSQGNVSEVCRGGRQYAKNKRFAYLDDYENGEIPQFIPLTGNKRKVRCIETGEIFSSISDAGREKGAKKITMVCKGSRKTSGGFHWEYV